MVGVIRSAATALLALAVALGLSLQSRVFTDLRLLTDTLLVMGGNENPAALTPAMQQELGGDPYYPGPNPITYRPVGTFGEGYIDVQNNPSSPYFGWDFTRVEWPAQIGLPILGMWAYEPAQQQGVHNIDGAIAEVLPTLAPGETALALGYSSSANVMVRQMRQMQNQPGGPTATDQLEFFLMGNPNRPNGGFLQRFSGLYVPFLDVRFDGSTPVDTPYETTDVSWQYDTAADFPLYPLNLLAVVNVFVGGLHGNYFPAEMDGARAFPDTTVGNITYITLAPPRLPLLLPLAFVGVPDPLLDLVEPALTVMVEWGYDRTISPGTPTTARLIPRINPITATVDLAEAVAQGVRDFLGDLAPATPPLLRVRPDSPAAIPRSASRAAQSAVPAAGSAERSLGRADLGDRETDRHERNRRADGDRR